MSYLNTHKNKEHKKEKSKQNKKKSQIQYSSEYMNKIYFYISFNLLEKHFLN